jgi:hypothetical protein
VRAPLPSQRAAACAVRSALPGSPCCAVQIACLLVFSLLHLLYLRFYIPLARGLDLIVAIISCLMDVGIFVAATVLLANPNASAKFM